MLQATLDNLHCTTTEDTFGSDSCRVEVFADGELEQSFRGDLNNGQDWPLALPVRFTRAVHVRLFDEDTPDADDYLGEVVIDGSAAAGTGTFDLDEASYQLSYTVTDLGGGAPDLVEAELQEWEASTAPGVWPNVPKADLIADVRATLADPIGHVDQAHSNFCGPTSIVFELVRRMPRRYVRLVRQVWETGTFQSRTHPVTASEGLRATAMGQSMSHADWVLIATMRESENAVFGVSPDSTGVQSQIEGLSTHWELAGWTQEVLVLDDVYHETTFVWGEFDTIRHAQEVWEAGGVAFLMIHHDLLGADDTTTIPPWSTHWIVFDGDLHIDDAAGTITFSYWTWAERKTITKALDRFESCMFGVVTGR